MKERPAEQRYCCCRIATETGPLGQQSTVVFKCLPRAMDMGHCADGINTSDGIVPEWCCKREEATR